MEIVLRASITFAFLFVLTRGLRRRALADLAPFELILLVTVGDMVQQGITQEDYSLTGSLLAVSTFGFWVSVLSFLSWRWGPARRVIEGVPLVIVQDGRVVDEALALEHLPIAEVHEAARQRGIADLSTVQIAVLEPSGKISFITTDVDGSQSPNPIS
jgi:uncharacterized membrane protein YcaP (DUF421 family)